MDGGENFWDMPLRTWPGGRHEHNDADASSREVLLIAKVLVSRDEDLVALFLRALQQLAIGDRGPAALCGRVHRMNEQMFAQRRWSALIEQN